MVAGPPQPDELGFAGGLELGLLAAAGGELVDDVAGVGHGAGEPFELGDDQGVAAAGGGEGLAQPGPVAVGAGDAVVDVDAVGLYAEGGQDLALGVRSCPSVETRA